MPTEFKISTLFQKNNHSRDQIIADMTRNPRLNSDYQRLTVDLKNRLVDFLSGTKTLPLTYKVSCLRKKACFKAHLFLSWT